jgi:hypothetical protein
VNGLIGQIVRTATAPIEKMSAHLFKAAALFFAAVSCLVVSAAFLTADLFIVVQS